MRRAPHARGWPRSACALAVLLVTAAAAAGPARPGPRSTTAPGYDFAELEAELTALRRFTSRIHVLLLQRGELIFEWRSAGNGTHAPLPTASSSKWLAAATIASLVDDGRLELDVPIARYLPELGLPKGWITLRQLLSHTSGYTPRARLRGWMPDAPAGRIGPVARYAPLAATPGARFCYGSVSFQVAGQIAERVTGQRWSDIFAERIARPCGMTDTRYPAARPQLAASAVSTAADYATFLEMFRGAGVAPNGRRVLSAALVEEMRRQHTAGLPLECTSHRFARKEGYGLGVWGGAYDPATGLPGFVSHFGDSGFKGFIDYRRQLSGVFAVRFKRGSARQRARQRFLDAVELVLELVPVVEPGSAISTAP